MTRSPYTNPLAKFHKNHIDIESVKQNGWTEQGILVVSVNDERLDFIDKEFVRQLGKKLYGSERRKERP